MSGTVDICAWTWNIWGGRTSKQQKWWLLQGIAKWKWLECLGLLAIFCFYDYATKASEAVQKIATDQKEYPKLSSRAINCWMAKIYLWINNCEKWLVTRIPLTSLKKLLKWHRKKSNNWPMVGFIHNGSEITIWMRHSFKTKSTKSKATFLK